ncbi:hypothetical protein [Roseomonas rosulenta]|uniref:hypothetical protein n=1 Tax=Roseomonas rosulenta TaxID=2748667 RepID=UPI0018E0354F|nr:hypothetical protein [Roseomonas rosulenta]
MIGFVFRWLLPAFGLGMVAMALLGAPGRGAPPLESLWHAPVQTTVTRARIIEPDGVFPYARTAVLVAWPPGSGEEAEVGAMSIGEQTTHRRVLEMEVARFPAGTPITVRVAGGRPWADVADGFALAWTIGMTLLGSLLAAVGLFVNRVLR